MEKFFDPKSVVVIGASNTPFNLGSTICNMLKDYLQYNGAVYAVNSKGEDVNGYPGFSSVIDLPETPDEKDIVEIRFKNTRKGFFKNVNGLRLEIGDVVAVEASPGHDIGVVSLIGELVSQQIKRYKVRTDNGEYKKVFLSSEELKSAGKNVKVLNLYP